MKEGKTSSMKRVETWMKVPKRRGKPSTRILPLWSIRSMGMARRLNRELLSIDNKLKRKSNSSRLSLKPSLSLRKSWTKLKLN